jgi:nucleoid DNA-binding protein/LysM repeat protein
MMEKISIQEIATVLIEKNGLKRKEAEQFVLTMFDLIKESLATDRVVKVKGLGTFKVVDIEARESVNVNTGERVLIEGHDKITFTPDNTMKELVNKPFSQFETVVLNEGVTFDDMPEAEDDTETPDTPEAQEIPEIPEIPENLEIPEIPENLEIPETPENPETPEVLDNLETPDTPETPDAPEIPEPEPVVEPAPELEPEPLLEPETGPVLAFFESEEQITAQPEEQSIEEIEEQPTEDTEEQPTEDTEKQITEETEETEEQTFEEEEYMSKKMTYISLVIAILACILSFAAGYYLRGNNVLNTFADDEIVEIDTPIEVVESVVSDSVKKDSVVNEEPKAEPVKEEPVQAEAVKEEPMKAEPVKVEPVKEAPKAEPVKQEAAQTEVKPDKYDQMDARVRTGAYRIVGLDHTVKVKAGETLPKIARRTLGPDMECYIEVFNGIKSSAELKEGQSIKIPKLELKKKKKANN